MCAGEKAIQFMALPNYTIDLSLMLFFTTPNPLLIRNLSQLRQYSKSKSPEYKPQNHH